MKRLFALSLCLCILTGLLAACAAAPTLAPTATAEPTATPVPSTPIPAPAEAVSKLHWFGTSAILYNGSQKIYFDPISLAGPVPLADIILITHAHTDHWSVSDLKKIVGPNTTLIIAPAVSVAYEAAKDELGIPATILEEGKTTEVNGVSIEAVPAFDTTYHRQGTGGVGYIVSVDGLSVYHAGGTAAYPEMAQYKPDIAILPMYSTAGVTDMMKLIPAKVFVIEHTSYYGAQAVGKLAKKDVLADDQTVADLKDGPLP
jgi:L-ascorbate metabolism protein UlaG (beta-lactamase superfamily)